MAHPGTVLITGGAGFIGSSLAAGLVRAGHRVRVLDDLSTGSLQSLQAVEAEIDLAVGDIRDAERVRKSAGGCDVVFHLAALPRVARSVADPMGTHDVNVTGTLAVLLAARDAGVRRVVYASSSSVYGDAPTLPKDEEMAPRPRSPYAAGKLAGEVYCRAATAVYGLETVSLRLFNVFGPGQDPGSEYAAVIPRFVSRMLAGRPPEIFGDGGQTRDFTHIDNVVNACILAASAGPPSVGEFMNIACGERISLLDLAAAIGDLLGTGPEPEFHQPRPGDVRHSLAAIDKARRLIGYRPSVLVRDGLARTVQWFAGRAPAVEGSR